MRRCAKAYGQEHSEPAANKNDNGNGSVAKEWAERGNPKRQSLRRLEHLRSGWSQAEVGKEHASHPDDRGGDVQKKKDRMQHGLESDAASIQRRTTQVSDAPK
jgi:hypothetical protein